MQTNFFSENTQLPAFEWLAEQMPGGFFIYLAEEPLTVLYINKAACRIFGCKNVEEFRELTGNTFDGMVHPEDYAKIQDSIDEQIEHDMENKMDYVVYRIIRKDGEVRWVDDYGHFTHLPGFGNVYYVFIGDITETRLVQEERERNRLLSQALEKAEQANIAKTVFLSNMSHEIRTPITAILGMNEIIRRETNDTNILSYSENIHKAGVSLLGIISDILDFSKIEAGKMDLVASKYSVTDLLGDLYNMIQFRAEEKGLAIYLDIDSELPSELLGDDLRLKQIITNLLTNAIKYTEKGSITLTLGMEKLEDDRINLFVSVKDTGIGIRESDMDRLFETFTRLDTKRTHTIEGAGLGLPICAQLLEVMGSKLCVESTYDVGSNFYFTLEQGIADPTPIGSFEPIKVLYSSHPSHGVSFTFVSPTSRVLLVDDTPMNLQVITGLLKPTKMKIDTVISGEEALKAFANRDYDLVFLDYRMPGMDGVETLHALREHYPEKGEKTPIVSLTASAIAGDRERLLDAGFTDYLSKPVNLLDLNAVLVKYLPHEKLRPVTEEPSKDIFTEPKNPSLPHALYDLHWLDPNEGVEYCGTSALYLQALNTFVHSIDEKAALLEECIKKEDWNLYVVTVHSLKSTSLIVGMADFSARAKSLELAGKDEDYEKVVEDTPAFLKTFRELKDPLLNALADD